MELRKKLCVYLLPGLLLCTPIARSQSFGDRAIGFAVSCKLNRYDISGSPGDYKLRDGRMSPACRGAGKATAASSADIGPAMIGARAATTRAKAGDGSSSSAESFDEAVLAPPSGRSGLR
jgi:hypothetical protein